MSKQSVVAFEVADDIATITFNRPDALNSVDLDLSRELRSRALQIGSDQTAKVIVLRGNGKAFMAGGDVAAFSAHISSIAPFAHELISNFHSFVEAVAQAPQPVIASIHGAVAGVGLSLVTCCDLVIAAESTRLAFAYKSLGLSPDGGATFSLPRAVGTKKAAELLLLKDSFTANEAKEIGIVNWVVPDAALVTETRKIAEKLATNSVTANALTKSLLRRSQNSTLLDQLAAERDGFIVCASKNDFSEGIDAFLKKRPPKFGSAEAVA